MCEVSVIIPTYNRFHHLLNTIDSIKSQTFKNIEIIVVNDGSTEENYYRYNWQGVIIINLKENTKIKYGYGNIGYVRNRGIERATGKYVAFCDDDDIWFPEKIELQLKAMKDNECEMSSTDGLIGKGVYDSSKNYKKYNGNHFKHVLKNIDNGKYTDFPKIWDYKFIRKHNFFINSSVIVSKRLLDKICTIDKTQTNIYVPYKRYGQDYACWLNILNHTNSVYVDEICFYYNDSHGNGKSH